MNILQEMLLIEEPSVFRLYKEMTSIASFFVAPVFTIALILEYFGEMDFGGVIKKLLLITVFMGAFYQFHSKAVNLSLESATYTLKKVSPRNLFVKKWYHTKVRTTEKREWNFIQSLVVPNLNDLLATAFFLLAKVFIWLLKLIYSSVYHLTYVFSGVTAILYFLGWTKDALKGTVQASLWCIIMPFVIVAILALVGNSIDESALGSELIVTKVDTIIWLFGVTLLLLISPLISYGMIKGDGIHSFGSKMGTMVVSSGMKTMALMPFLTKMKDRFSDKSNFSDRYRNSLRSSSTRSNSKFNSMRSTEKQGKDSVKENNQSKTSTTKQGSRETKVPQNPSNSQEVKTSRGELKLESPTKPSQEFVKLQKQNFKFKQKYWENINPHKAEATKKKYGIEGNTVNPNKVHRPVKTAKENASPIPPKVRANAFKSPKQNQVIRPRKKERFNELR
jgi:hypothetical protein